MSHPGVSDLLPADIATTSSSRPLHRNKPQLACRPCRAAKLKCGREIPPCKQCCRRGREAACEYTEQGLRQLKVAHEKKAMQEKLERLEAFVNEIGASIVSKSPEAGSSGSAAVSNDTSSSRDVANGSLRSLKSGSSQWIGPSSWRSVLCDVVDIQNYFAIEHNLEDFEVDMFTASPLHSTIPEINFLLGYSNNAQIMGSDQLIELMPARVDMDRYVGALFSSADPIVVMLHGPTFQKQYSEYWAAPTLIDLAWFGLLAAVGSLGAEICFQTYDDKQARQHGDLLRVLTSHALANVNILMPQPNVLETLLICVKSQLVQNHDVTLRTWQMIGLITRICYQAGYHRDPSRNLSFSLFECEMRRRTWMVVQELEITISCNAGMVSFIDPRTSDTQLPMNLIDSDINEHSQSVKPRPENEYTLLQIAIWCFRTHSMLGEIAALAQYTKKPSQSDILAFASRFKRFKTSIPDRLRWKPIAECITDSPLEIAHRLRVEMACLEAHCLLYWSFLRHPQTQEARELSEEYKSAAIIVVELSIEVLQAIKLDNRLAPIKILVARHVHDFNLAAMILCSELKSGSNEIGLDRSVGSNETLRTMLRQACHLWDSPDTRSPRSRYVLRTIISLLGVESHIEAIGVEDMTADNEQTMRNSTTEFEEKIALDYVFSFGETSTWLEDFGTADLDDHGIE